jgi:hypothetical protein
MTALFSIFCFGLVVSFTVLLGVIEAREVKKRERIASAARSEPLGGRASQKHAGLRAVAGDSAF